MNPKTLLTSVAVLALAGACATTTTDPAQELTNARDHYQAAANGPAPLYAPSDLETAKSALQRAELAYADNPSDPRIRADADFADRAALLADAKARRRLALVNEAVARAQLASSAATAAADPRGTHVRVRTSQRTAPARGNGELKETELAKAQQALAAEREARIAAEREAAAAQTKVEALSRDIQIVEDERGTVMTLSGQVLFPFNESRLLPASRDALNNVAEVLEASPDRSITVEGHTDAIGGDEYNEELSQRRAEAVREFLLTHGVPSDVITARGEGEESPVTSNDTPEGRANNRRVEVILAPPQSE